MRICRTVAEMRAACAELRAEGTLGLVPTMGALHAGHMALVGAAVAGCNRAVASVFVNPTQFENPDDLAKYPADTERDLEMLRAAGVAAVFLPEAAEIYPEGAETIVETTRLANMLHGEVRPGHFRGVATVVTKLFSVVRPDRAYFGKKDYQQLHVVRQLAQDLLLGVEVVAVETVRDADGLALSSRNVRLTEAQRAAAPVLQATLQEAAEALRAGSTVEAVTEQVRARIEAEPLAQLEGFDVVKSGVFVPATGVVVGQGRIGMMMSAAFGPVLLLDQLEVDV
ncbi:pantothenate synthetase [Jannaschia pagri]|uniref:Pantothenate synthetase n=1 Tax=Jannaschia pagri TaxID=2829797 RepID=A0ABQ4NI54_9RHOB|nr:MULTISPECIES: pantoate--beta-alanine ligase [unclassified Jannaschia]GIT89789.1 pantothenate synthetase [Jannaschia sp. AI_61]GIT94103.1 pantothenate synthetase [Jannaschia sp. AI_62]